MTGGLYRALARWRWGIALVLAAGCGSLGWAGRRLAVDPSNRAFFIRGDESYRTYQAFRQAFGSDDTIVLGLRLHEGFSPEVARWLSQLTVDLRGLPDVEAVRSLASARLVRRGLFGQPVEESFFGVPGGGSRRPGMPFDWWKHAPPDVQALTAPDNSFTALVLTIAEDEARPDSRHELVGRVQRLMSSRTPASVEVRFSGTAVEQDAFIHDIEQDRRTLVPVTVAVIALLVLFLGGDWRTLAYSLAVMGGALAGTNGLMVLTGTPVNLVSALLAPLILIVSVSATVHVAHSMASEHGDGPLPVRLASVYRRMFLPCALALGTTALGFLSLLVSRVSAIRTFGCFGAAGTAMAWALSMLLAPAAAGLIAAAPRGRSGLFDVVGRILAASTGRMRRAILALSVMLAAGSLYVAPSVRASTDLLTIFPPAHRFRRDTEEIQRQLGGIYPLEVLVRLPDPRALRDPASWEALERFQEAVRRLPNVSRTIALTDLERYLRIALKQPRSSAWLTRFLTDGRRRMPEELARLADEDFRTLRLTALLESSDTAQVEELAGAIPPLAGAFLPAGWRAEVTGQTALLARMSQQLVRDELASVGLAFAVILAAAWLGLRSLRDAVICVGVNILPVAGLFACMAALRVPLNTATAMIASIALGLVFDNTIYFMWRYRAARAGGRTPQQALAMSLTQAAQPMIASSLILSGGFAIALLGRMTPTVQFGALSCFVIGAALLSDLLVLPSVVSLLEPGAGGRLR
jgi:predicted RND superfamily exporter protein